MSGNNYFLDTNAIIALLNGNESIESAISNANQLSVSVINIVEFMSFADLTVNDKALFVAFLKRVTISNLSYPDNADIINLSSQIRITNKLKLPDAIVAASALLNNATLITNDKQLLSVPNLQTLTF